MSSASHQTDLAQWQDDLESALSESAHGPFVVRVYKETKSTQDIAKSFAPGPAVVIADQQSAGRGRLGRAWVSSPGSSVLMSVVFPDNTVNPTHDRVSMLAGVAVARAIEHFAPEAKVRLKWPNDVMIDQHKLAGILIEAVAGASIIGIGINVEPTKEVQAKIGQRATSLTEIGRPVDRLRVIERVVIELERVLYLREAGEILAEWRSRASLGQTQTFEHNGQQITGQVMDLDPDHGLIVRRDSGEIVTLPAATTSVVS